MIEGLDGVFKLIKGKLRLFKYFMLIYLLTNINTVLSAKNEKVQTAVAYTIQDLNSIGDTTKYDTVSQAMVTTTALGDLSKSGSAEANSIDGGVAFSTTDSGKAISKAEGMNSLANAQSDQDKISTADASTDSKGGSAVASALNNSYTLAKGINGGKAVSSSNKNARASSLADGNSNSKALATDDGTADASAVTKTFEIGIVDDQSQLDLNTNANADALATASDKGQANASSMSLSGSIGIATDGGNSSTNSDSDANSEAHASDDGIANSKANSLSMAVSSSNGNDSQSNSDSTSKMTVNTAAGEKQWDNNQIVNNPTDSLAVQNVLVSGYKNNPSAQNNVDESQVKNYSNTPKGLPNQYVNEDIRNDWASVYFNLSQERYIRNSRHEKSEPVGSQDINYNDNIATVIAQQKQNQKQVTELGVSNSKSEKLHKSDSHVCQSFVVNWTYIGAVAKDIGMGSEGDLFVAGLDGQLYHYDFINNSWTKYETDFQNIIRVDVGLNETPYVVTSTGESYFLSCEQRWEKLPGCARDIGTGRGGEVYKIGCEKRPGGFRIYKLICQCGADCNSECKGFNKTFRYEKENSHKRCKWINMDGGALRIAVHPYGNPFVINDSGRIQFYNGIDWKDIPETNAIDLSVSNEGLVFYVSSDFSLYKVQPQKLQDDYTNVKISQLLNNSALTVTVGPYSQPVIIGEGYRVFSSSKLGYN